MTRQSWRWHNERRRSPRPWLPRRLPSGRGSIEQPNAGDDGEAALTPVFWLVLLIVGALAGLTGAGLMALLFAVEHLAFGTTGQGGGFAAAVAQTSAVRRVLTLAVAGLFGGVAWYVLRRLTPGRTTEVDDVLWTGRTELSFRRSSVSSVISEIVIGLGASIGREAAPKTMGGVYGSVLGRRLRLSDAQVRLLIACGGGAGLASVYNVPLGGAFFTAEILCGSVTIATMLPALACAGVATLCARVYLPAEATYPHVPAFEFSARIMVWALLAGPVIGLASVAYVRLVGWLSHHRIGGVWSVPAMVVAFVALALIGLRYPQLFGNGQDMARDVLAGHGTLALLLALAVLKPLVTGLCLGSGASGGLFTPVLSTGAVFGGALGLIWTHLWPGSPLGAYALVGAAAMIGSAMQAPVTALALVLELTHSGFALMVPMLVATTLATAAVRYLDGYSIYSARLPAASAQDVGREPLTG